MISNRTKSSLAVLSLVLHSLVQAQVPDPSAEQWQLLQQLPEDQRQAVFESLMGSGTEFADRPVEFPETVKPLDSVGSPPTRLEEIRIRVRNTLIIDFAIKGDVSPGERLAITQDPRLARLLGSQFIELDQYGVLTLQGIAEIPLAGLTEEQAAKRLLAEDALELFDIGVTLLPVRPVGVRALFRFGYDLFAGAPTTFAPATDIPVPSNYVMGPGDTIRVQLFGKENRQYSLTVTRDGTVNFPEIGPVSVAGLAFDDLRDELLSRVDEQMIGVRASITMGPLRSIRIFVLGDARRPGSFTVSGLSTMTNALFHSGGIKQIGTLRNIELKRNGNLIRTLDLYDLLLHGDTSDDVRLLPGDVIFIPPVGPTVAVDGEVKRPAIYELRNERTADEAIALAGGMTATAFPEESYLERINENRERVVLTIDLTSQAGRSTATRSGDALRVASVLDRLEDTVMLAGHVVRTGPHQWREGMRLSDLIPSLHDLRPKADPSYVLVRRESSPDQRISALSADLTQALLFPNSDANPRLQPRDAVTVFDLTSGRVGTIEPLLLELRLQATADRPFERVTVGGSVRAPGPYPLEPGMRLSDLIRAGGNLLESAYALDAELTRYHVVDGEIRTTELIGVDLAAVLAGDSAADLQLQSYDILNVKEVPEWREQGRIDLIGEVRFPGRYPVKRGETLSSVVARAGGLTDLAFPEGSVFLREDLRRREQEQIDILVSRLERDLSGLALRALRGDESATEAQSVGQSLLGQLRATEATGRLVIDVEIAIANPGDSYSDIVLKNGDRLMIPDRTQEVTVLGEVQYATSHVYEPGLERDGYINRSGGLTRNADDKRIYIVRANGAVFANPSSRFFRKSGVVDIQAGDTIVAPLDTDRVSALTLWTGVTQVIYQLAIAVAAVNSF